MLSVNCKINRAIELLKVLNGEFTAWKELNAIETTTKSNELRTVFVVGVKFISEPPALKWSLIVGEILFNLRCALDHLVYFLAISDSGVTPPENAHRLMFPVTTTEARFADAIKRRQLHGICDAHRDIIKSLQPFTNVRPEETPLFALHYLNILDKHRQLHMAIFSVVGTHLELKGLPPGKVKVTVNGEPLEKEDWVIRIESAVPCAGPEGPIALSIRLGLLEERFKERPLLELLNECVETVKDAARQLKPSAASS